MSCAMTFAVDGTSSSGGGGDVICSLIPDRIRHSVGGPVDLRPACQSALGMV
jgi:hypothetical protein